MKTRDKFLTALLILAAIGFVTFIVIIAVKDAKNETGAFRKSADVYPLTATYARPVTENLAVYGDITETAEDFTESEPETEICTVLETEETTYEQTTSETETEIVDAVRNAASEETGTDERVSLSAEVETESESVPGVGDCVSRMGTDGFLAYGIWTGDYWHFTPEQIDAQWRGLKTYKPVLPSGTTRAWQKYLYDRLAERGAEWFYKYAVAQAMQESGMNPLNQQGNDAVPDKGLFSFRIYYWDAAKYGDVYDYHANINAYVDRISPYLTDSSEAGIYRAISQHYLPDGTTHMNYVNMVLGRLNELWEVTE